MASMGQDLPPTTVFVDTSKNCMDENDLFVEDDDMLDPAAEEEALAATFRRQAPRVTKSDDDCWEFMAAQPPNRPQPSLFLQREQTSLCPGTELPKHRGANPHLHSMGTSTTGLHSQAASCSLASGSIPSTHLQIQYMESKRRLSRSMRQTEMTRRALRRQQLRMSGGSNSRSYRQNPMRVSSTSMYSLPSEMVHSGGNWLPTTPQPQTKHVAPPEEPTVQIEASTRDHIFQWANTTNPPNNNGMEGVQSYGIGSP